MAKQLFENNAGTRLNGDITDSATSIPVTDGSVFPVPGTNEFFLATISDGENIEIVKVTDNTTNTLTVVRAQESTTAYAFQDNDKIELLPTKGTLELLQRPLECIPVKLGDETTDATTGTAKLTWHIPYNFEIEEIQIGATEGPTGSAATLDMNAEGTSVFSTNPTIDDGEDSSLTAATPPVLSTTSLTKGDKLTFDIDAVGSTTAGKGYYFNIIGRRGA